MVAGVIAVGIGCRRGCPGADIVALVRETLALLPSGAGTPAGLFTLAEKGGEPGLRQAAATLRLPLVPLDRALLRLVAPETQNRSLRVEAMFGLPSVAETAALAGAGAGAVLLVPRRASATATCALAGLPPDP